MDHEGKATYRVSRYNNFQANKLFLNCSIVIKIEFRIEVVFQSIKFEGKKLFSQETLRESAAITATHCPRAEKPYVR
jgi:hypothetical protein